MKTKSKLLWVAAATAGVLGYAVLREVPSSAEVLDTEPKGAVEKLAALLGSEADRSVCDFGPAWRASYDYQGGVDSNVKMGSDQPLKGTTTFSGKLALEAVEQTATNEWVLLGQFSHMNQETLDVHGKDFEQPFLIKVGKACEVRGFARFKSIHKRVGQVQQSAMHDLWLYAPPKDGLESTVFENGMGRARAQVTRRGAALTRSITSYDLAWRQVATFQVRSSVARAQLGAGWLENFESREEWSGGIVNAALSTVKLSREASPTVAVSASASRAVEDYAWENLLALDLSEANDNPGTVPASEQKYVALMKDATLESAFERLTQHVDEKANIEDQWHEMTGFLNGHPEQIEEFARGMRESDFPESVKGVSFLALSKTVHPQAREALRGIRNDITAVRFDRLRAGLALVTRKDVGVELAHELRSDALTTEGDRDDAAYNQNALMHLGVLANLHRSNEEVQAIAHETITQALSAAGTDLPRLGAVFGAIGNLADPKLMSKVASFTHHPDPEVRTRLPLALGRYPYGQTEDLVVDWLQRETHPTVKQQIYNVLHHQLADAQTQASEAVALEAANYLVLQPTVFSRESIIHIIGPTKDRYPAVKEILMTQLALEFRNKSGLFSQIVHYLSPEETSMALARMPEFAHQYGKAAQASAEGTR